MAAFHYVALNTKGQKQKGMVEADSEKSARQIIREKNLTLLEIISTKNQRKLSEKIKIFRQNKMTNKELALMTRQLATLLAAGIPLGEVLTAVSEQSEKPRTKGLILSVRSKVLEGYTLAAALRDFPNAFSPLYCSTVAAGEKSGHLDLVLQRLSDYTEQQFYLQQKIKNALIYPTIMILVSIGIVGFLLEFVVPKMVSVYTNMNQTLPALTNILIAISSGIKNDGLYIFILFLIAGFFFRRTLKNNSHFREKMHRFCLRIPVIGNAIKTINTARFSRTLAILSSAGVSVLEAMKISSALITNIPIHKAVTQATDHVREGANIYLALKQTTFFPAMSIHLIASGEASGQLENMLERAANNQENDITQLIETTLTLFEPAIILLMGAIVLFIVLAVMLPIFQLNQLAM